MAQTDTYQNALALIESYTGTTFIDIEKTRIKHLINARAHAAYREHELWESFLVSESMTVDVNTDTVPYEGAVAVATAETTKVNANAGNVDTFFRAHQSDPWGTTSAVLEYDFFGNVTGAQLVGYKSHMGQSQVPSTMLTFGSATNILIEFAGTAVDYYAGGTVRLEGFDTSTVTGINAELTIASVNAASYIAGVTTIQCTLPGNTSHPYTWSIAGAETIKTDSAYVSYKKRLQGTTYGDGTTSGDTTDIPLEWFEYICLGVYADLLASDGFSDKSLAWEGRANKALQRELERIDSQRGHQFIRHRVRNHASNQSRY